MQTAARHSEPDDPLLAISKVLNSFLGSRPFPLSLLLVLLLLAPARIHAQPSAAANLAFDAYTHAVEQRLALQHSTELTFLNSGSLPFVRSGQILLEDLASANPTAVPDLPDATIHHWRASTFVPNATAAHFQQLLHNLNAFPRLYAPEVLRATVLTTHDNQVQTLLRVREHHGLTVTMDTAGLTTFGQLNPTSGFTLFRSTSITEIANPDSPAEHPLAPADEHGFLYRLNSYWSWQERNGGLFLQLETISLSRSIPTGLGWLIHPYTDNIPRTSLTFTLKATRKALQTP